jgi:hypothetical protein
MLNWIKDAVLKKFEDRLIQSEKIKEFELSNGSTIICKYYHLS